MSFNENVVVPRESLALLNRRLANYRRLSRELRDHVADQENLLHRALHDLALQKGVEPQHFIRKWLTEHRTERGGEALGEG